MSQGVCRMSDITKNAILDGLGFLVVLFILFYLVR